MGDQGQPTRVLYEKMFSKLIFQTTSINVDVVYKLHIEYTEWRMRNDD